MVQSRKYFNALVRYCNNSNIRINSAKRIICAINLFFCNCRKQRRLPDVRQSNNSNLYAHGVIKIYLREEVPESSISDDDAVIVAISSVVVGVTIGASGICEMSCTNSWPSAVRQRIGYDSITGFPAAAHSSKLSILGVLYLIF